MKKNIVTLAMVAAATFFATSCSDDSMDNNLGNNAEKEINLQEPSKCWTIEDANLLTDQDIIFSEDETHIEVSKALLQYIYNSYDVKTGDVVALYLGGILNYLEVQSVKENGVLYLSLDVKNIELKRALELCHVNLGQIRLSTDIYMDESQPKRVNNSGEADDNGIINNKCYIETAEDGVTVFHPKAVTVPAHYAGMNSDDPESLVKGGFIGVYVGQVDGINSANGFGDFLKNVGSKIGKTVKKVVIEPVKKVVTAAKDTFELLYTAATGGHYGFERSFVDIDQTFNGEAYTIAGTIIDNKDPNAPKAKEPWTKDNWNASVKGKFDISLKGHVKASSKAYMDMEFEPMSIEKFQTGITAYADVDLDAKVRAGVEAAVNKAVSLHRFSARNFYFNLGPIPVQITIYPEIIWKNQFNANVCAFAEFKVKYQMDYDAYLKFAPGFDAGVKKNKEAEGEFTLKGFGAEGTVTAKTGIYLRTSINLYSVTGPVFDLGAAVKAEAKGTLYLNEGKVDESNATVKVDALVGDASMTYAIKFPPLKDVNEWLYNKLSWESGTLLKIEPFYKKELFKWDLASGETSGYLVTNNIMEDTKNILDVILR